MEVEPVGGGLNGVGGVVHLVEEVLDAVLLVGGHGGRLGDELVDGEGDHAVLVHEVADFVLEQF